MRSGVTRRTARRPDCGVSAIFSFQLWALSFELKTVIGSASLLTAQSCELNARLYRLLHLFGGCDHVFDAALQVEGLLGDVVVLAFDDLFETANGVRDLDVGPGDAGEDLGHVEGLREEA